MSSVVPTADTPRGTPPPADFEGDFHTDLETLQTYSSASGPYRIRPRAVAVPRSVSDLQSLVRWAAAESTPMIPRGGATGMPGGNVGDGIIVDLTQGFDAIGPVDAESRRVRVGPGVVAADVNRAARKHGLFLPPVPSSAERCTIGGMAANNAAGARTFKYGSTRDWIAGLEVVLADGRRVELGSMVPGDPTISSEEGPRRDGTGRSTDSASTGNPVPAPFAELRRRLLPRWESLSNEWPAVRKNSSGYALDRFLASGDPVQLMVGSEGTLGLITSVSLKLAPIPEARGLILTRARDSDDLLEIMRLAERIDASACEFFGRRFLELARLERDSRVGEMARDAYSLVMVEVEGTPSAVEEGVAGIQEVVRALDSPCRVALSEEDRDELWEVRHAASPVIARAAEKGRVSMQFIEDSVVPPSRLPEYLSGLEIILERADTDAVVFGHAGDGNVHVNPLVDVEDPAWRERVAEILESVADLVASLGGTLSGEHGDGRIRAPYLSRIWSEEAIRSFRKVKETLDPRNLLNPGVILPVTGQDPLADLSPEGGRN